MRRSSVFVSKAFVTGVVAALLLFSPALPVATGGGEGIDASGTNAGYEYPAGSTLIPMGAGQGNVREAYKFVFQRMANSGEVQWMASPAMYGGVSYPAGTFITRSTVSGPFDRVVTTDPLVVEVSYSIQKRQIALFHSGVLDSRGQVVTWEEPYFESLFETYLWGSYFTNVDEADIASGSLADYDILILPTIAKGYVSDVVAALDANGVQELAAFVQGGGTLYAQGDASYLPEAVGLIPAGTVRSDSRIAAGGNLGALEIVDAQTPLTYAWTAGDLYVLDDPLLVETDPSATVARYSGNLADPAHAGSPALMSFVSGLGRVIITNGHPSERADNFPMVLDALLYGMAERADVRTRVFQTYNPSLPWYLLPGREANVTMDVTGTLYNYWSTTISGLTVSDWVRPDYWVDLATIYPTPASVTADSSGTTISWTFSLDEGQAAYGYTVLTGPSGLDKGWKAVSTSTASYADPIVGRTVELQRGPLYVRSAMSAFLLGDRDIELDGVYPLPAEGAYFDMAFPLENKEETSATGTKVVDIVPLKSPVVDVVDQTRIPPAVGNTNFGTNDPVFANLTIWFYDNPNYPLPDGVSSPDTEFTVADADATYWYNATGYSIPLPAKRLEWTYGTILAFDHKEPMFRYGLFVQEEYKRTVSFLSDPVAGSVVLDASGGSVYAALGGHPIPYHEYLQSGIIYVPESPEQSRVDYEDIWSRPHSLEMRTSFFDIVPFPPPEEHAVITSTYEMLLNGQRVLDYPADSQVDLNIMIKSWNGYPPYDPVNYPYHMDMIRNETLIREALPKGLGYNINYLDSRFSSNTEIADIVDTNAHTIVYYRQDLNASTKEIINVDAWMTSGNRGEGTYKVNDGARFVYRQIAVGPSRYEVHDNHIQAVQGIKNELDLSNTMAPVSIGTYGDEVFLIMELMDPGNPLDLPDPYVKSHGFGDIAATTYVGGRINKTLFGSHIAAGEKTIVRIEIDNNLGYDLTNVTVSPTVPAGFNVTPLHFNIPPIWYDFHFLDVPDILDAWKGVYYFEVVAGQPWQVEPGRVYQIDFTLQGSNVPPQFIIPPALVGIKDPEGKSYVAYGRSEDITLEHRVPGYVDLTDARVANEAEKTALEAALAADDQATIDQEYAAMRTTPFTETPGGSDSLVRYQLPAYASSLPWMDDGGESFGPLYVIARMETATIPSGRTLITYAPKTTYTDHFGRTRTDWGRAKYAQAHGPAVFSQASIQAITVGNLQRDFLTAGVPNLIQASIFVPNLGDDIAQDVSVTAVLPASVNFHSSEPAPTSFDPISGDMVWDLGDVAPYSQSSISLTLFLTPPYPAVSGEMLTLVETVRPQFTHMFLGQPVMSGLLGPPALNAPNVVDLDPPDAPILDAVASPVAVASLLVTGATEADATVEVFIDGVSVGVVPADPDGRFSIAVSLVEGPNVITATATDSLGNGPGDLSAPLTVVLDTTAPGVPVLDPMPSLTSSPTQTVTGSAEPLSSVVVTVDDVPSGAVRADASGAFAAQVTLWEGVNMIAARASDALGNAGPYSAPLFVTLDTTPPTAAIDMVFPDSAVSGRPVTLAGHGSDVNGIVAYRWESSIDGVLGDTKALEVPSLSAGTHALTFSVMDAAGHWSSDATEVLEVLENTIPRVEAGGDLQVNVGEAALLSGVLSQADSATILYEWDFEGDGVYDWSSWLGGEATHTFTEAGTYTATIRVTDADGDVGTDTVVIQVVSPAITGTGGNASTTDVAPLMAVAGVLMLVTLLAVAFVRRRRKRESDQA